MTGSERKRSSGHSNSHSCHNAANGTSAGRGVSLPHARRRPAWEADSHAMRTLSRMHKHLHLVSLLR